VILGHVELIREAGDTAPPPGTVDAIIRAVNHGSDITEQLLAFGRKQVNSPERVVVGEFLLDVMRVFAPLIGHDITVSVRSDPTLGSIWIDRTQLERIILNLVLNAREAMPDGGSLDIEARHATRHEAKGMDSASVRASLVAITVTDTGRGMDPATKDHMFEPFFTTKANGHATGLGLATVYGLMKQNRGYVSAESEVGEGTRFLLLFSRDESSIPAPSGPPVGNGSRGASVLVAEDNDEIRNLLASILVTGGFDVNLARNGAEALSLCEDGLVVDLLITDLMMPQMGGVELARRLRRIQPEVGTVFVSGHPLEKANLPELDAKREAYLAKPFTPAQLRQEVHRALANSRPTPAE